MTDEKRSFLGLSKPALGLATGLWMLQSVILAQDVALPPEAAFNSSAGRGDIIWINLRSDSARDYTFSVDTGATLTVLDKSWEYSLEPQPRPRETMTGSRWPILGVYSAPPLILGGVRLLTGQMVVTEDLAPHFPGHPVDGILGMDCLSHYCLQFDFSENKIRFLDPGRLDGQVLGNSFPIAPIRGCFFVNDNVAGVKGFGSLIDTGCNFDGVLIPDLFRQWTNQLQSGGSGAAGEAHYPDGILGGVVYTNLYLAGEGQVNLVGLHFLARNLVTLNFPGRTLYLQQRSTGSLPGNESYFTRFYKNAVRTN